MTDKYNFEGDVADISERQLEFINQVILEQDLKVNKVFFEPVGPAGENFIANVKRITVEGDNGKLKIIAKVAPSNEVTRTITNSAFLFINEHVMYTEVLPKFAQLQKSAGVPIENQLRYAKCYGFLNEAPNEIILLEDLDEAGFVMLNKFKALSDECVRSILKDFAILHSLSYVLKNKEPDTFNLFKGKLINMWMIMASEEFMALMKHIEDDIITLFEDNSHKNILKNKLTDLDMHFAKLSKYEDDNKNSVIHQGDAWTNNIMFKFEEGKLVQSVMIDYQMSKNSNPVVDVLYMIFCCTDHETRSKYYYDWIDYYHSELDNSLSYFDLKANYIYSRDRLEADLKRYGKLLFGMSIMAAGVQTRDAKEIADIRNSMEKSNADEMMESTKIADLQEETVIRLKEKIIGLIDSFTQFGLL